MPLNITQLEARLLWNLHNDTNFTTAVLDTYLTLGQNRMVRDSPQTLGIKNVSEALLTSGLTISLESNVFHIIGVYIGAQNRRLQFIPHQRFINEVMLQETLPSGCPWSYTITAYDESISQWTMHFDCIADADYTINYWYYWMPAAISGTTAVPAISAIGFDELLIWAATMVARETNDPDGHAVAKAHYDEGMLEYRAYEPAGPDYRIDQMPGTGQVKGVFLLDPAHFNN